MSIARVKVGIAVLTGVVTGLAVAPALAASQAQGKAPHVRVVREADRVVVRQHNTVDFDDVTVKGELMRPDGSFLLDRDGTRFRSLVRLRADFNVEMLQSADGL